MKKATTITIESDVYKALKICCAVNEIKMSDFISEAIEEKLEKQKGMEE